MALCFLAACSSNEPSLKEYSEEISTKSYLSEELAKKDFYIMYAWTTWCGPCINAIQEKLPAVQSYLDSTGVSVGLVAICADDQVSKSFLELNDFMKESNIESYFFETGSFSLHDRWALNSYFSNLLNGYEDSDGVPIVLVVGSNGEVIMQDPWVIGSNKRLKEVLDKLRKK